MLFQVNFSTLLCLLTVVVVVVVDGAWGSGVVLVVVGAVGIGAPFTVRYMALIRG